LLAHLEVRVGREGEVCLGHADREIVESLRLVSRNVCGCFLRDVDSVAAVDIFDNFLNLFFDWQLDVVPVCD
jgi:hypothetical protein